jgi:hypothetical protein
MICHLHIVVLHSRVQMTKLKMVMKCFERCKVLPGKQKYIFDHCIKDLSM